jgi:hypothetical protein
MASDAWAMGNFGLSTVLRNEPVVDSYGDEDAGAPVLHSRLRWRLMRWAMVAGGFLAYVNHWPGGH